MPKITTPHMSDSSKVRRIGENAKNNLEASKNQRRHDTNNEGTDIKMVRKRVKIMKNVEMSGKRPSDHFSLMRKY